MTALNYFSKEELQKYSFRLSRQTRGGALFFTIMTALLLTFAFLLYLNVIFISPNTDKGFLASFSFLLFLGSLLLSLWFLDYRRRVNSILELGYWAIEASIIFGSIWKPRA